MSFFIFFDKIYLENMKLTLKEIEKIATLARLNLSAEEKKMYTEQLSVIFDYIEMLNEVNTDQVSETYQVTGLKDVVREDEVAFWEEEDKQKLINNFPDKMGNLLKVKAVFDNNDE